MKTEIKKYKSYNLHVIEMDIRYDLEKLIDYKNEHNLNDETLQIEQVLGWKIREWHKVSKVGF